MGGGRYKEKEEEKRTYKPREKMRGMRRSNPEWLRKKENNNNKKCRN